MGNHDKRKRTPNHVIKIPDVGNILEWTDIKSIDDLVPKGEAEIVTLVESDCERVCPHLRKIGAGFRYCSAGIPDGTPVKADPMNPVIRARVSHFEIQLWCYDAYERCTTYQGIHPPRGSVPMSEEN